MFALGLSWSGGVFPQTPAEVKEVDRLNGEVAQLHQQGRYPEALKRAKQALELAENTLGPEHPETASSVNNLGFLYQAMGQYDQALPLYQRALAIKEKVLGPEHPDTARSVNNLGALYDSMGQYDQALPLYQRAFSMLLPQPLPVEQATYAGNLCRLHGQRHAFTLAIFYCKLAVNAFQQVRQNARSLDPSLQRSLTGTVAPTYRALAKLLIQEGRIAEAEQVLGMLKEYEFFEFVRRSEKRDVRSSRSDFTPEEKALADRMEANARELSRIYGEREKLRKLKTLSTEQQRALKQLDEQSRSENEKLVKLFADIKMQLAQQQRPNQAERAKGLVETKGKTNATLLSLRQTSNTNPALIYFLPEDKSTLFLIHTKDGLRQVQSKPEQGGLGEQALNEKITLLRQLIEKRDNSYRKVANELYMALIAPVEPYLKDGGVDMVMLYLTDALRYLPFAALYDEASGQHLIEKYPLAVYTHVAQDTLTQQPQPQWAAVGLGTSQKTARHAALPWVKTELARVVRDAKDPQPAGVLAGKRYLDNDFTNAVFMQLMSGEHTPAVMHIATHFSLAPGNDQNSSLVLGNGDEVTLAEIAANAQLGGYELITLSACETAVGGGKVKDKAVGAEVEGLGAVLQKQGAKAVMATLWKVEDTGTALFMEQFYKARGEQRKTTKAQALREAQQALLSGKVKASDPAKHDLRHPYYWAPFILMGNWL